jgi:hypothetical protein
MLNAQLHIGISTHTKIFMVRVTRQIKCLIAQAPGVIPHPLPEVNFLMVEIPTPKPYIFMIRVYGLVWGSQSHFLKQISQRGGAEPRGLKC